MDAKTSILIVEDERLVAEDIRNNLINLGYSVVAIVSSGAEAAEKAQNIHVDLVLIDIVLKGEMDGIETAGLLRSRYDVPVVYLTAYADNDTLEKAKLTEPFGYIVKPFDIRDLHSTIEMALYKFKMEKAIRDREAWYSTMMRSIGEGVIATDVSGLVSFVNPIAERLTGWPECEALGKPLSISFLTVDKRTKKPLPNPMDRTIRKGTRDYYFDEALLLSREGKEIPIDESFSPIRNDDGEVVGGVLVFKDVSERERAQAALRAAQRKLFESEKLAGLGMLTGHVVHEIGNPLAAISNSVQVLQGRVSLEGRMKELMNIIVWETDRLRRSVDQLREFAKPRLIRFCDCDPGEVAEKAIKILERDYELSRGKQILRRFAKDLPVMSMDPEAMEQVILNLVKNSLQAVEAGGRVTVVLRIQGQPPADRLLFRIRDNGTGLPDDQLKRVFEPFFSTKTKGMGLGMTIVKQIVEAHGGTIAFRSKVDIGTTVDITIPIEGEANGRYSHCR